MKAKQAQNRISCLTDSNGRMVTDPQGIKDEILQFYTGLLGTTCTTTAPIKQEVIAQGYLLTEEDRMELMKPGGRKIFLYP